MFSTAPVWSRLFLSWADALDAAPREPFLRAAVACECLAAGFDLIDDVSDGAQPPDEKEGTASDLAAGVTLLLLAHEVLARLDLPAERRTAAGNAFSRAGRRALAGHQQDVALRLLPAAAPDALLALMRRRSGGLLAVPCQCAALLAGAPWRTVALASRFGAALGCAAQLEDDLADRAEDAHTGRQTIPLQLTALYPDGPELVEATTWVLIRRFLEEAAEVFARLPSTTVRLDALWPLLPPSLRAV